MNLDTLSRNRVRESIDHRPLRRAPDRAGRPLHRASATILDSANGAEPVAGEMSAASPVHRVVDGLLDGFASRSWNAALAPFALPFGGQERHLLSVCRLALMLGRALCLGRPALTTLGVAAMLHDVVGKASRAALQRAAVRPAVPARRSDLEEDRLYGLLWALQCAGERFDQSAARSLRLFAEILRVAEDYDLLVAPRPGRPARCSPAKALKRMWTSRGRRYDPILLAVLARSLGPLPPGTLVELNDGTCALVMRSGDERGEATNPLARVVRTTDGAIVTDGSEIRLGRRGTVLGVRAVIEPAQIEEQVSAACRTLLAETAAACA